MVASLNYRLEINDEGEQAQGLGQTEERRVRVDEVSEKEAVTALQGGRGSLTMRSRPP